MKSLCFALLQLIFCVYSYILRLFLVLRTSLNGLALWASQVLRTSFYSLVGQVLRTSFYSLYFLF